MPPTDSSRRDEPPPQRVLVTDGETRAALAAVRSLGRAGLEVHVTSATGRSLAGASRWARRDHRTVSPDEQPGPWAEELVALARNLSAGVLPVTEVALGTLFSSGAYEKLSMIGPPRADYHTAIDKLGLVERAQRLGIGAPRTHCVPRLADLARLPDGFRYPVVAKPRFSRVLAGGRWWAPPVEVWRHDDDLRAAARRARPDQGDTLLQQFVPGRGEGLFALCERGAIRARLAHARLREKPPLGGVSVLRQSVEPAADVANASERLLADLGYTGVAMVEFRRAPDGAISLMEINPRLWGSLQLAIDAGVDFPRLMWEVHRGRPIEAPVPRVGVRSRWLLGDVDRWLACARDPALRRELGTGLGRLCWDFLRAFFDGTRSEVFRLDDPVPFRRELGQWLSETVLRRRRIASS